ncbi:kinase domain-containing protein [Pochonia chlamydosporia 170]|uniref:Kinase domain-containing protein n=1 Tax=Pochonia chlamydosporia 170 TaxID=1380566 RepID=A0A179F614_METCM|nr:kinase domain-containing protein [Pochonia chlamydosporia 170]OAQ60874.1 kinase domain-containing protein [Pochonia chlamydosporia 170]
MVGISNADESYEQQVHGYRPIGCGNNGEVVVEVSCKELGYQGMVCVQEFSGPDVENRLNFVRRLRHQNLVNVLGIFRDINAVHKASVTFEFMPVVMIDLCGQVHSYLNEIRLAAIVGQVCQGLAFLENAELQNTVISKRSVLGDLNVSVKIRVQPWCEPCYHPPQLLAFAQHVMFPWKLRPNMVEDETKWAENSYAMDFWRKLPCATSMGGVVKLIDCVLSDDRCRQLLIQRLQPAIMREQRPTLQNISLSTPASTPRPERFVTEEAAVIERCDPPLCEKPPCDNASLRANSPLSTHCGDNVPANLNPNEEVVRDRGQTPEEMNAPSYPSPSPTPRPQRRSRVTDGKDSVASTEQPARKRRRTNEKEKDTERMQASSSSSSSSSIQPPRKVRGPGKKKKKVVPEFRTLKEPLRRQISEYTEQDAIRDVGRLIDAFVSQSVEEAMIDSTGSWVSKMKCHIDFCDRLQAKGKALTIRGLVQRRFNVLLLIAEFLRLKKEEKEGKRSGDIASEIKKGLFPNKTRGKANSEWDNIYREGKVLYDAVQENGFGVLIFPLCGVTKKSLNGVSHQSMTDFIDYIDKCQPNLKERLRNLSYILPRLMTQGLPPGGLGVDTLDLDGTDAINRCCPLPPGVDAAELHTAMSFTVIPSWPKQAAVDVVSFQDNDSPTDQGELPSQVSWNLPSEANGLYGVDYDLGSGDTLDQQFLA